MTTAHANQLAGGGPQARLQLAPSPETQSGYLRYGIAVFAAFLLACTFTPLRELFFFSPAAVRAGQWWRLATHPFVHVSWYHLLLDGAAFLLLYSSVRESSAVRRLIFVAAGAAGSVGAAWLFAPQVEQLGLCGLSGVAHGLMAVTALEMICDGERAGWWCLALVAGKAVWEAATGHVFFEWIHGGMLGTPIAVSHLGGVVGATAIFALLKKRSVC